LFVNNGDQGLWFDSEDLKFPFTLSACKNLKSIFISAEMSCYEESIKSALPAIVRLLKTAPPSIRSVILKFECYILDVESLARFDWSLLDSEHLPPRIELRISGQDDIVRGSRVTPGTILDALARNEALMDLVQRNLVFITLGPDEF
jgi:hypothetical protein